MPHHNLYIIIIIMIQLSLLTLLPSRRRVANMGREERAPCSNSCKSIAIILNLLDGGWVQWLSGFEDGRGLWSVGKGVPPGPSMWKLCFWWWGRGGLEAKDTEPNEKWSFPLSPSFCGKQGSCQKLLSGFFPLRGYLQKIERSLWKW